MGWADANLGSQEKFAERGLICCLRRFLRQTQPSSKLAHATPTLVCLSARCKSRVLRAILSVKEEQGLGWMNEES